jgi:hypothetical protein
MSCSDGFLKETKDVLKGYKIAGNGITDELFLAKGEEKFQKTLVQSKNDFLEGTIFEFSAEESLLANRHEPDNCQRVKDRLESKIKAWIYVTQEGKVSALSFVISSCVRRVNKNLVHQGRNLRRKPSVQNSGRNSI